MTTDATRTVLCSGCQAELEIDVEYYEELAGTEISCPECDTSILVPGLAADAEPTQQRKKLGLCSAAPAAPGVPTDIADATHCPACGAELPDPEAILCMACGTNRVTGEQIIGIPSAGKKPRARPAPTVRRAVTGIVAVLVIVGCAVRAYLKYSGREAAEQSETVAYVISSAKHSHDYAASITQLEMVLHNYPKARNLAAAESTLDWVRGEAEQVAARTEAMAAEMARAQTEADRAEAVRILDAALEAYPGAQNEQAAFQLRERIRNRR